jgi:excisionase family DNA binding protein
VSNEKLLLRVGEVSQALGLSRGAVYALILDGSIPSVKIGRSRRVAKADLEAWVQEKRSRAVAAPPQR